MKKYLGLITTFATGMVLGAVLITYLPDWIRTGSSEPPLNFVAVTDKLHTSGQPSPAQLSGLKRKGYGLVINLAPPTSLGSLANEGLLVAQTGVSYLNIAVDWDHPRYEDFELFGNMLRQAGAMPVLVHCQVNRRASVFTFLYRVVYEHADPERSWANVNAVWVPDEQWKNYVRMVLKRNNIGFDPF